MRPLMYKSLLNNSEGDELIIGGDCPFSGVSILFQTLLFLSIGALPFVISCIQNQVLNFAQLLSHFLPAIISDIRIYGISNFFLSDMAYNDGATLWDFLVFLFLILLNATVRVSC